MKMEILARCGFRCDLCPAYNPNIINIYDKKKISEKWQQYFGFYLPPEKIGCDGCLNNSQPLDSDCPVRPCVNEKQLDNCAYCPDFDCDKLKTRMDALGEILNTINEIPEDDYLHFIKPYESRKRLTEIRTRLKLK
jgi:hypothetical protein